MIAEQVLEELEKRLIFMQKNREWNDAIRNVIYQIKVLKKKECKY